MSKQESLLAAIESELARQDAALEEARATLASFGDCEIHIAEEILQQLDDACTVRAVGPVADFNYGLRG
jgi:hypothetical protein